ncbi:thiol reductant ABC exporter subunit CydC [Glutamicibacter sp. NPDC087344]|uniref:thiol reductant ABC exporter subunit CydC n=1 Tax=Glutamicibacter sp. NPDC087344 TaxID=3363994 RepID=UPI00381D163A
MRTPRFLPRELIAPRQMVLLTVFSVLKTLGLVLTAYGLGQWIASMASGASASPNLLLVAAAGVLARAAGVWGLNTASRRMGLGAKERLRAALVRSAASRPGIVPAESAELSVPVTATLASHGIDKLDDYFTKFIPAFIGAMVLPLLLGIYILQLDWISAVVLILTVPLVPIFMALIGLHTQETLRASQSKLDALAHQMYELAQGLPALLGLGRARRHGNAIAAVSDKYRQATMANLKTVFLSSFWLELISTLSVAVLAVMIGVRLVGGNMDLAAGLIILILAPELFSALREVGSAYHAADDGLAAYQRYQNITTAPARHRISASTPTTPGSLLELREVNIRYGETEPVHQNLNLTLKPGQRIVLSSASGTGKTTVLRLIAESCTSDNSFDAARVNGQIYVGSELAVISQHPRFNTQTGTEQLAQDVPAAEQALIAQLADRLDLGGMLPRHIAEYSPGELRRLEVLRALLRLHSTPSCRILLADEPTAHLDDLNAAAVRQLLSELPDGTGVLIASHDPLLASDGKLQLHPKHATPDTAIPVPYRAQSPADAVLPAAPAEPASEPRSFNPLRELFSGYGAARKAVIFGTLGVMCAVALSALSGWLIVESSYQPAILHLTVSFVMVRTLGIGRAVFRYLEQLAIHDAVLGYAGALREKIWSSMVGNPARWGLVSRSSVVLRFLLAEVDELRDLLARVLFPPIQALVVWCAGTAVLFYIQPAFGISALCAGLFLAFPGRWLVRKVEGLQLSRQLNHRLNVNQQVLGILGNQDSLRAYGSLDRVLEKLDIAEAENTSAARRHAVGQGAAPALGALLSGALAVACAGLTTSSASFTALAVLLSLALAEPATSALGALQQGRALKELTGVLASRGVGASRAAGHQAAGDPDQVQSPSAHGFLLQNVSLAYGTGQPVIDGLHARIEPAGWTALTGPSGSGKSTLLTALLGALPLRGGRLATIDSQGRETEVSAANLGSVAWCPQEAHLFDSTLRRNLLLGADEAPQLGDDRLEEVLAMVGLDSWFRDQPQGLDTRIGTGGHRLSGGQRCKLAVARAIVAGKQVILLDEPTAHLGQDESVELMRILREALQGRTVVLITHDERLAGSCQEQIRLVNAPAARAMSTTALR